MHHGGVHSGLPSSGGYYGQGHGETIPESNLTSTPVISFQECSVIPAIRWVTAATLPSRSEFILIFQISLDSGYTTIDLYTEYDVTLEYASLYPCSGLHLFILLLVVILFPLQAPSR